MINLIINKLLIMNNKLFDCFSNAYKLLDYMIDRERMVSINEEVKRKQDADRRKAKARK